MDALGRHCFKRDLAARFHAALLSNPNVQLMEDKARISISGGKLVPVVDYAKREAELFYNVHERLAGNEDKR